MPFLSLRSMPFRETPVEEGSGESMTPSPRSLTRFRSVRELMRSEAFEAQPGNEHDYYLAQAVASVSSYAPDNGISQVMSQHLSVSVATRTDLDDDNCGTAFGSGRHLSDDPPSSSSSSLNRADLDLQVLKNKTLTELFNKWKDPNSDVLGKEQMSDAILDSCTYIKKGTMEEIVVCDKLMVDRAVEALMKDAARSITCINSNSELPSDDEELPEGLTLEQFFRLFTLNPDCYRLLDHDPARQDQGWLAQTKRELDQEEQRANQQVERELQALEDEQIWKANYKTHKTTGFWLFLYLLATAAAFTTKAHKYAVHHEQARAVFGECIIVARGAAQCLNLNCALILIPMLRTIMTRIRQSKARHYVPLDNLHDVHMVLGCAIVFWTAVHVGAHMCDFYRLSLADDQDLAALVGDNPEVAGIVEEDPMGRWMTMLRTRAGITGIIMVACAAIAFPLAWVRKHRFNTFWYSHHLFVILLICLCVHGTGNLLEPFQSVFWVGGPLLLYLAQRVWRETPLATLKVLEARLVKSVKSSIRSNDDDNTNSNPADAANVLSLHLEKPASWKARLRPGMYAFLKVPGVSLVEFHPFTMVSCPSDDHIAFAIKNEGDWTAALQNCVECILDKENSRNDPTESTEPTDESEEPIQIAEDPAPAPVPRNIEQHILDMIVNEVDVDELDVDKIELDGFEVDVDDFVVAAQSNESDDAQSQEAQAQSNEPPAEAQGVQARQPNDSENARPMKRKCKPNSLDELVVHVEGPFGAPTQSYKKYNVIVLIGAGIGVTPMISVLKEFLMNPTREKTKRRVYFYWSTRDYKQYGLISSLMEEIWAKAEDHRHELQVFHFLTSITKDVRGLGAVLLKHATRAAHKEDNLDLFFGTKTHHQVQAGRPKWNQEFLSIRRQAVQLGQDKCGVFVCGIKQLVTDVEAGCKGASGTGPAGDKCIFDCYREVF